VQTHIRVLAVLQLLYASIGLLLAFASFVIFGGAAAIAGFNAPAHDTLVAVPILAVIGTVAVGFFLLLSLPRIVAAVGLLNHRPWARMLTLVVSAIGALDFPAGTALGVYAFWVLTLRDETAGAQATV
jgi:hypothetical protein